MGVRPSAAQWPIAAAMLPFPAVGTDGTRVQDAAPRVWAEVLGRVARAGFGAVDLTDSWLRAGDLEPDRLRALGEVLEAAGLTASAISVIRRSVIDAAAGEENLAYSHRTLDAAAALGVSMVSVGLHRPLTSAQREVLWFWTVPGPVDDPNDRAAWELAVRRLRELAEHAASVGVSLSLETYEDTFLGTADGAVALLDAVDHPAVGLNPDIGNLVRLQRPIERWEQMHEKTLPRATYWHVKNYLRSEHPPSGTVLSAPAPMSDGVINYRWVVEVALSAGFTGAFCVEHYGGDSLGVSARNRDYLRGLLTDLTP